MFCSLNFSNNCYDCQTDILYYNVWSLKKMTCMLISGAGWDAILSFKLKLCVLKQRWCLEDLGLVGRQSSPAVTDAVSQSSCSVTSSTTAVTAARMSKTAKPVSATAIDLSKQIKEAVERDEKCQMSGWYHQETLQSPHFKCAAFVIYGNICMPMFEMCCVLHGGGWCPLGFCTSKEKRSRCSDAGDWCVIKVLSLFVVSSGDVCGKKTNPCGEDAICNQTNTNAICQCKPGFKRNQKTGQCDGSIWSDLFWFFHFKCNL